MARPSKRPADSDAESEDEVDPTPSDGVDSTPPSGSRKRRRISDDALFDQENRDGSRDSTPPSNYESDDEDEEEEIAATQAIKEKRAEHRDNEPAECGILTKVEVHNFMCHERMEFTLGPLINFICGKNGSGKSAILTAIVLCLGGKAAATNRGQSLKNFIKEGKDQARIMCSIKNEGEGAYMPEEFGDVIEIERYFSRTGGSGFKIKSEKGRIVSTKKMELEEICDHFGLQIDNPLNVLSQDQARQFITASSPADKYRFFVKGVQLEQLDQDYRLIEDQLENIQASIDTKRPDIKILEQKMQRAKAKDDAMKKKDGLRMKLRDLRRQIAWVQVQDQEALRDEYVREIEEADRGIEEAEARVTELDIVFQSADQANEQAKVAFDQARVALQELQDERKEKKALADEAKQEAVDSMAELRKIQSELTNVKNTITARTKDIEQEEERLIEVTGGGAAQRLRSLETARTAVVEARQILDVHKDQRATFDGTVAAGIENLEAKATVRKSKADEVKQRENNLQELLRNRDNSDTAFHDNMPNLLNAIGQEKRFQQRPIGPLGKHIRLLKPEWSSVLEISFGSTLSSFLVTSKQDSNLLSDIMKRVRCFVPILIGNNQRIDVSKFEPAAEFLTVLRALEVDNDMVKKQLCVAHFADQTILVPDLAEGSEIMFGATRPERVKRCYTFDPHNKRKGQVLSYTRNGDPSQDPIREYVGRARMKTDAETQVRSRQDAVQEAKDQLHQAETDFYKARDELHKARQNAERHKRREGELRIAFQKAEDEVEKWNDAIKEDNVESGRLEALKQALNEAQEQRAVHEELFKDAINDSDTKKDRLRGITRELNDFDARVQDLERERQAAQARAQNTDKKRAHDLQEKNEAAARVDDARQDRATMDNKRQEKEQRLQDFITQANNISGRVNIPEGATQGSLEQQYRSIRTDLENHQRQLGGSAEEITQQAKNTHDAYKKGLKDLRDLERLSTKLKASLIERRERWKKFRSHISVRAKAQFTYLLSERSFRGRLITDHKQKLLELSVEPDITKRDGSGRSARTLSGGEKSFSQICLLLSIWEAMGSPIRCLDEFDVFMDAVNRNLSVNLLVEAARQSVGRQFILISPGTKNDIQKARDISAQEIDAPERGQQRLNFRPAATAAA